MAGPGQLPLRLHAGGQTRERLVALRQAVIASWTGRDRQAMEQRLVELEALGIPRPPAIPMLYPIAASRVTTSPVVEVIGAHTSGEAELVLLALQGRIWVGVGSDHTDRTVEATDAALSKQLCDKPICRDFWSLEDIEAHWDTLCLRSHVTSADGHRALYQEGEVAAMLPIRDLLALWSTTAAADTALLFCGTLPTIGGIRATPRFEFELEDPVMGRRIAHGYDLVTLPFSLAPMAPSRS